jgi:enamine deaminase RidA (YjgF/YER057c/UK114 family)
MMNDTSLMHRALRFAPHTERVRRPGLEAVIIRRDGLREIHATVVPRPGESSSLPLWRLQSFLHEHTATVAKLDVFGAVEACEKTVRLIRRPLSDPAVPITWVQGMPCSEGAIAGIQVFALAGTKVETVTLNGQPIGRMFHDRWARHCLLGNLLPEERRQSRPEQTTSVYRRMEQALLQMGMTLSNLARTWLFLDDILSWYGEFNTARTEIFTQRNLFVTGVPASTGVGVTNPAGAALAAAAWAVQPLDGPMEVCEVASPLQCTARRYGSCFSRAVELRVPGLDRLLISGTASISPDGRSQHSGDVRRQIGLTMEVVEAILSSRQMRWSDVTRATAYFKQAEDGPRFAEWCEDHNVTMPVVVTQADICRDELLFEIELDAVALRDKKSHGEWEI